jgi:phenylacetate-CoA ligase
MRLKEADISPSSVKTLVDLYRLPFTTKDDLRENYPFGFLSVSIEDVVRIHASSGTTGIPVVVSYTRGDLDNWSNCIARCLAMSGVGRKDVYQVILGYGMFTGGLGFHYGAEKVGATVIPSATGNTRRQVRLMKDFGVTAFTSIPSYTLYMAEVAQQLGVEPSEDLKVKTISCGAEAWSKATRKRLETIFDCTVFNSYGLAEVCGPGVAFECIQQDGMHVWDDYFIAEVVDPNTGEKVENGEEGEMVLTTLNREAMPLLRYKTRDLTSIIDDEACECGRSHTRISWISGRTDDMVKVRGVNIFPSQVEDVLMKMQWVGNNYQLILSKKGYLDELKVKIEVTEELFSGELKDLMILRERMQEELESILGIRINVELVEAGTIDRVEGKANRVLKLR